jgi:hypothetical protein
VLHPVAGEHPYLPVVHPDWNLDLKFHPGPLEHLPAAVWQLQTPGSLVEELVHLIKWIDASVL